MKTNLKFRFSAAVIAFAASVVICGCSKNAADIPAPEKAYEPLIPENSPIVLFQDLRRKEENAAFFDDMEAVAKTKSDELLAALGVDKNEFSGLFFRGKRLCSAINRKNVRWELFSVANIDLRGETCEPPEFSAAICATEFDPAEIENAINSATSNSCAKVNVLRTTVNDRTIWRITRDDIILKPCFTFLGKSNNLLLAAGNEATLEKLVKLYTENEPPENLCDLLALPEGTFLRLSIKKIDEISAQVAKKFKNCDELPQPRGLALAAELTEISWDTSLKDNAIFSELRINTKSEEKATELLHIFTVAKSFFSAAMTMNYPDAAAEISALVAAVNPITAGTEVRLASSIDAEAIRGIKADGFFCKILKEKIEKCKCAAECEECEDSEDVDEIDE